MKMDDLISRQAAIDALDKIFPADPMRNDFTQGIAYGTALAKTYVEQLPSAQPTVETKPRQSVTTIWIDGEPPVYAPVRHGKWVDVNGDDSLWRCSVCGETQCCDSNYCGECGAMMDEE